MSPGNEIFFLPNWERSGSAFEFSDRTTDNRQRLKQFCFYFRYCKLFFDVVNNFLQIFDVYLLCCKE